jgi:predicted Zn-dependent protease
MEVDRFLVGDAATRLRELPGASIDTVITSPPYLLLRDYGIRGQLGAEPNADAWADALTRVLREIARVLKPTGSVWLNVGDAYARHQRHGAPPKSLLLAPERLLLRLQADGWTVRNKVVCMQLLFLKYGRDAERQADDLGYAYSIQGGYDVRAMPAVFATLKRVGDAAGAERLPNWMSSHPAPEERIERIEKMIAEKSPPPGKTDRDALLAITNGMPYGPNPRQGFFEGGVFKHPEMKFQVTVPRGWKAQNLAAAVVAEPQSGKAGFQLTLAKAAAPAQALQQFSQNQAISGVEPVQLPIQGLDASSARFIAKTEGGQVGGLVTFVSYQGKTFQLLGLAPAETYASNEPVFKEALASFKPLTDPAALNVQPARVKVVSVPQSTTLAELARQSSVPADKLAIVNQVDTGTRLEAGTKIKLVEGTVRQASTGTVAAAN